MQSIPMFSLPYPSSLSPRSSSMAVGSDPSLLYNEFTARVRRPTPLTRRKALPMTDPKYAAFTALDPFFQIVQQGLAGLVDGAHYFDTIAADAVFEFRYDFPGWPRTVSGRDALVDLYSGYGNNIVLHGADALVVHRSQDPRVVIIEYDVHGKILANGDSYDNRFISVVTIEDRKIVHWRDYMDSLAAMTALSKG